MNKKRLVLIILCIMLAAGLSITQYLYIDSLHADEVYVDVLIAKKDIQAGEIVNDNLTTKRIPESSFVNGMATSVGENNLFAKIDIPSGTYILTNMVSQVETLKIENNNRRITIGVNITAALAGRIKPGDKVDIGFVPLRDNSQEASAQIIATSVPILELLNERAEVIQSASATNNMYDTRIKIPAVATLVVDSPEQGIMIKEKEARGSLFFLGY